jgi:hypothetical protein
MCYEAIICPRCSSVSIVKNGKTAQRKQRYLCKDCRRQFIRGYTKRPCGSRPREQKSPRIHGACAIWKWMSSGRLSALNGDSAGPGMATTASGAKSSPSSMNAARTPLAANSCNSWGTARSRVITQITGSLTPGSYRLGDTGPAKKVRAGLSVTT